LLSILGLALPLVIKLAVAIDARKPRTKIASTTPKQEPNIILIKLFIARDW
jgi:hypothetical protein